MSSFNIRLSARNRAVEIRLRNANLDVVASGLGSLEARLDPGIYQVQYRAGDRLEQSLVALRPGQVFTNDAIDLPFATPMPVDGTSTSRETYRHAVQNLSKNPDPSRGGGSQFMLFVRNMTPAGPAVGPESVRGWRLLREDDSVALDLEAALQCNTPEEWAGCSVALPAGGYVLETGRHDEVFRQSVWLADNWITGIFAPNSPEGALPGNASVQMAPGGLGWEGWEPEAQEVIRMSELALIALRERRSVLPPETLKQLLTGKFRNPMLGIIGAHTLLLERKPNAGLLELVLENLAGLVPGHPDVVALRNMAVTAGLPDLSAPGVSWPPMLMASFQGLLAADARDAAVIVEGSPAEQVAPFLVHRGTWTTWRPPEVRSQPVLKFMMPGGRAMAALFERVVTVASSPASRPLRGIAPFDLLPGGHSESDRASWQRLVRYLREFAQTNEITSVDDIVRVLRLPELGAQLGLPRAVVQRLAALAEERLKEGGASLLQALLGPE